MHAYAARALDRATDLWLHLAERYLDTLERVVALTLRDK